MPLSIVILAAGQGTRMRSETPKVLHEISGKPMIHHILDAAVGLNGEITVVLNHRYEEIKKRIERNYPKVSFHRQDADNYPGTGGALRGMTFPDGKVLILNGDMPLVTTESLKKLVDIDSDMTMSVIETANPSGYGRVKIEKDNVRAIVEERDCTKEELEIETVNAGVYCVDAKTLQRYIPLIENDNSQREYYLTDIVEMAVSDGLRIKALYVPEAEFKGVNSRVDLSEAEEIMQKRIRRKWMLLGTTMHMPESIYIDARAVLEGECTLENGVRIEGECVVSDSRIRAHSVVECSKIIESSVGPLAHIRPGSYVEKSHIGNFVEIKKSNLKGIKAGHLSYLGDCEADEGSNIGAGTITCNYDGKSKHRTVIGKNVFIGSDTQLVAPVTLGDDTIIAAGTTVTGDIPSGALGISRTPLKIVAGFFYRFFGRKEKKC